MVVWSGLWLRCFAGRDMFAWQCRFGLLSMVCVGLAAVLPLPLMAAELLLLLVMVVASLMAAAAVVVG